MSGPGVATPGRAMLLAVVAVLLAAATVLGAPAAPASAHATVVATNPAHGSELQELPAHIVVTFDEPVQLFDATGGGAVIDAEGVRVDAGPATLDAARTTLTIPLRADLPVGVYIASWRVVSADSHPVGGSIQFGFRTPALAVSAPLEEGPDPSLTLAVGVTKGLLYASLVPAFGLVPAALVLGLGREARRRVARWSRRGILAAAVASVLQLGAQWAWQLPPTGPVDVPGTLAAFAGSTYAVHIGVRLVLLAAAFVIVGRLAAAPATRWSAVAVIALGLGTVVSVVLNGHGGAGPWVYALLTIVHASAAVAWLGGLALLGATLLRGTVGADLVRRLPRWSGYAAACVLALSATGMLQAVDQVGYLPALTTTTYGIVLLAKLALAGSALVLGALGALWIRRRRTAGGTEPSGTSGRGFGTRVRLEAGLVVAVVLVSGLLSSVPPARDAWAPVATAAQQIGPYEVTLEANPARTGRQSLRVTVTPPRANFDQPEDLQVTLRTADGTVRSLPVELPYRLPLTVRPGKGTGSTWVSEAVEVLSTGRWVATVTVVVEPLEQYTGELTYEVR